MNELSNVSNKNIHNNNNNNFMVSEPSSSAQLTDNNNALGQPQHHHHHLVHQQQYNKEKSAEKLMRHQHQQQLGQQMMIDGHQISDNLLSGELPTKKRVLYDGGGVGGGATTTTTNPMTRTQAATNSITFSKSNLSPTKAGPGGKFSNFSNSKLSLNYNLRFLFKKSIKIK